MIKNEAELKGVHPHLAAVVREASKYTDFQVLDGLRTAAEHAANLKKGASKIKHSLHQDGLAVDLGVLVDGKVVWKPWSLYEKQAIIVKAAAKRLRVEIEWGGDWKTFKDGVHFQLAKGSR
jgi:peptidoglycan L-alanyl-D-glutamate endopeptidase CwlK